MSKTKNQTFTTQAGKEMVLFPNIPRDQFRFVVDLAQDKGNLLSLKAKMHTMSIDRILAFRYDMQRLQVVQHQITCFETVKAVKQRGAAGLYKASLATLVRTANEVLATKRRIDVEAIFAEAEKQAKELAAEHAASPNAEPEMVPAFV